MGIKISRGREPSRVLQHESLINKFPVNVSVFKAYLKPGRAWNKRQLLKEGVVEERLRTTAFDGSFTVWYELI